MSRVPKVGDVVHYFTKQLDRQYNGQDEGPYAAIVVRTFANSPYVSLKVLPAAGASFVAGSVARRGSSYAPGSAWDWPDENPVDSGTEGEEAEEAPPSSRHVHIELHADLHRLRSQVCADVVKEIARYAAGDSITVILKDVPPA